MRPRRENVRGLPRVRHGVMMEVVVRVRILRLGHLHGHPHGSNGKSYVVAARQNWRKYEVIFQAWKMCVAHTE